MTLSLNQINIEILSPALELLPAKMDSQNARRMMLAIGLQESGFATMVQYGGGPAHSYWQFERGGGVKGVLQHPASAAFALHLCDVRGVEPTSLAVWQAMATDAILGAGMARLLLWTDAGALPATAADGWKTYLNCWRPGKPHPLKWPACWAQASVALGVAP